MFEKYCHLCGIDIKKEMIGFCKKTVISNIDISRIWKMKNLRKDRLAILASVLLFMMPVQAFAHLGEGETVIQSRYVNGDIVFATDPRVGLWSQSFHYDITTEWGHEVSVRSLNNGTHIFFLLSWPDSSGYGKKYDGAEITFENEETNSEDHLDWNSGNGIVNDKVISRAEWSNGQWHLLLGRTTSLENGIEFSPGTREESFIKFLVWDGSNGESIENVDAEKLTHFDFIMLPYIDTYPKDVYVWSAILAAGSVVFLVIEQRLYRKRNEVKFG